MRELFHYPYHAGITYLFGEHLGSTSAAIDPNGQLTKQWYYAFGGVRYNVGTLPTDYAFTGQRSDASDGLLFYNARYYDATIGRFIQPDTIVPNLYRPQDLNRYAYVQNNPLRYTDPTGHHLDEPEDNGPCDDACQQQVQQYQIAAANPVDYCTANPSSNGCYKAKVTSGGTQDPHDELCAKHKMAKICREDTSAPPPQKDRTTPWGLGWEWLTGQGPRQHIFLDDDPMTQIVKTHYWIEGTRAKIAARLRAGNYHPGDNNYDLSGPEGVPIYLQDATNLITLGNTGNLAATFLGSYDLHYQIISVDLDSDSTEVAFHVHNDSTLASAAHPPVLGYTKFWLENISPRVDALVPSGPMSMTTQDFYWKETIAFR